LRIPGVKVVGPSDAVVTAKVPRELAERLRDEARTNYSTISGEVRRMLVERFGEPVDDPPLAAQHERSC
jgi:hypothetical protein